MPKKTIIEARQNQDADWVAAPIRFNAQSVEIVDVPLDRVRQVPSEWERLSVGVGPLLGDRPPWQMTDEDITFLSDEAGIDRQLIVCFAASARRAKEEDLLQQEVFYGWFRQNLPTDLNALFEQGTDALLRALENSIRDNIVPRMSEQDLNDFVARLRRVKARRALQPGGENKPA